MINKEQIEKLFEAYHELELNGDNTCSGYGLDASDIDYEAFSKALEKTFFPTTYIPIDLNTLEAPQAYQIVGDCVAQCLDCVRQGKGGTIWNGSCKCEKPSLSMDSSRIRDVEKEYKLNNGGLPEGFRYIGWSMYTYNKPSWTGKDGKRYHMEGHHAKHLTLEEAGKPEIVRSYRVQQAEKHRQANHNHDPETNGDLAIVFFENSYNGENVDIENYILSNTPELGIYNSVRYFLIPRKKLEAEVIK